ncbi:MAG: SDR family NAD(P)-dependent oxidoreductase, partial [Gemmatimonadota bacterium]|nr:SDR family NAD(P)-dependent oxidoreductase [Gemmatimonadota bacterium]
MTDTQSLSDRVALVTGASSGIGRATALRLASAGASVAVTARRRERLESLVEEIEEAGGRALAIEGDVVSPDDVRRVVDGTLDRFGTVDILVN